MRKEGLPSTKFLKYCGLGCPKVVSFTVYHKKCAGSDCQIQSAKLSVCQSAKFNYQILPFVISRENMGKRQNPFVQPHD